MKSLTDQRTLWLKSKFLGVGWGGVDGEGISRRGKEFVFGLIDYQYR